MSLDIFVTDCEFGSVLRFPMLPQEIVCKTNQTFCKNIVIGKGEVALPTGGALTRFGWKGVLPGAGKRSSALVYDWRSPAEIQGVWSVWREDRRLLKLTATSTPINHFVYLDKYDAVYKGCGGGTEYEIWFVMARDASVGARVVKPGASSGVGYGNVYSVKSGDTPWTVALKVFGDGSRYGEVTTDNR